MSQRCSVNERFGQHLHTRISMLIVNSTKKTSGAQERLNRISVIRISCHHTHQSLCGFRRRRRGRGASVQAHVLSSSQSLGVGVGFAMIVGIVRTGRKFGDDSESLKLPVVRTFALSEMTPSHYILTAFSCPAFCFQCSAK